MSTLGDIMMHVGEQGDKILSIYIENPEIVKCGFWCKLPLLPLLWHANTVDEN